MTTRHLSSTLIGLALVAALTSCSQIGADQPTPSPTPSSPAAASPSPSPSTTPDMDALYAEAEWILRRSFEINTQYLQQGDYGEYPPELDDLLADPYLSHSQTDFICNKENGFRLAHDSSATLAVRPLPGVSMQGSEVALGTCLDTRPAPLQDAEGNVVSEGSLFNPKYFFKHFDGRLKLFVSDGGEEIDECPFE